MGGRGYSYLRTEYLYKLFGIFCLGGLSLLHLFISIWNHEYLFYTLGDNPTLLYLLFTQIVLGLDFRNSFSWLLWSLDMHTSISCFLFNHFLTLWHYKYTGLIHVPIQEPAISLKKSLFLLLENAIRNQDLDKGMLTATGVSFLFSPLRWQGTRIMWVY